MDISQLDLDQITVSDNYIENRDYVIFDKEFISLSQKMRSLFEDFNSIFKRWQRFDRVAVSKSVFDYETMLTHMYRYCDRFYVFRHGSLEVSIFRYQSKFSVRVDFGDQDFFDRYYKLLNSEFSLSNRFSSGFVFHGDDYDSFQDCYHDFIKVLDIFVSNLFSSSLGVLF